MHTCLALLLGLSAQLATRVSAAGQAYAPGSRGVVFYESFDDVAWPRRWNKTNEEKYQGRFQQAQPPHWKDHGLELPIRSQHYALSSWVEPPLKPAGGLVFQFEVKHSEGHACGGSYLKLLTGGSGFDPNQLSDRTPYSIMFGPDRCGDASKVHFILRHRNAKSGLWEDKHLRRGPIPIQEDTLTHVYTLQLRPDSTFSILLDGEERSSGSLLNAALFQPPIIPQREVPDPGHAKPGDWVDAAQIPDPSAVKPADWDDRPTIPDVSATKPPGWLDNMSPTVPDMDALKPEAWDEDEDGPWERPQLPNPLCKVGCGPWVAPLIPNPAYKGEWTAPLIDNPDYKGPWVPTMVPNPHHYEESQPLERVGAVGAVALELWTIDKGYVFDNVILAKDDTVPSLLREELWRPKYAAERTAWMARQEQLKQEIEADRKRNARMRDRRSASKEPTWIDSIVEVLDRAPAPMRPLTDRMALVITEQPRVAMYVALLPFSILGMYLSATSHKRQRQRTEAARKQLQQKIGAGRWVPVKPAAAAAAADSSLGKGGRPQEEGGVRRRGRKAA